MKVEAVPP